MKKEEQRKYKEIKEILGCSDQMIVNALRYEEKPETRGRKRKTTRMDDRRIIRFIKRDPAASSNKIQKELNLVVSAVTVRRRMIENNLYARSPRKVPLLTKRHANLRLQFAKKHTGWTSEKWRNILWSDESKIVLFGGTGSRQYVRRPPNTAYEPQYTTKTVKHGGAKVMVWGSFSYYGVGPIHLINGIMNQQVYVDILENVMLPYAEWNMPLKWIFQQDNDPKHTSRSAKNWFQAKGVEVLPWPAQSPDLNPIENLWADVKKSVAAKRPSNAKDLWVAVQEAWQQIPLTRCQDLIDSMPRRCAAVIKNHGYTTKY